MEYIRIISSYKITISCWFI